MRTLVLQWNWCECEQIFCCVGKLKRRTEREREREREANNKRGKCNVSSSLFLCTLCFFSVKVSASNFKKSWAFVIFTFWQMRTKFQSDFLSVSHLWILIVLQSLRLETFTTLSFWSGYNLMIFFSLMNMECVYKFLPKKKKNLLRF